MFVFTLDTFYPRNAVILKAMNNFQMLLVSQIFEFLQVIVAELYTDEVVKFVEVGVSQESANSLSRQVVGRLDVED
jgi:hypothetical protein